MKQTYKDAGVDIDAGNRFVEIIKPFIKSTHRRGVISELGGYGGFFALDSSEIREPVLVSGTDGVGTKLRIAIDMQRYDTIGIDLVAMCVNDIACCGASPLFFLDYFATSKLEPESHSEIVKGIAAACQQSRCALIGGETAEMPDIYRSGDFDLAGFAVGIIDRSRIIDGSDIGLGQAIIGIASSGFHSNGYSLIRHIVRQKGLNLSKTYDGLEKPLGELLLAPTKLYSSLITHLQRSFHLKGIAHITGGGFLENIPRILPTGVQAEIALSSWTMPPLFPFMQQMGNIDDEEMFRVFNCGIGMVLIVPEQEAEEILGHIAAHGETAWKIGVTVRRPQDAPAITLHTI